MFDKGRFEKAPIEKGGTAKRRIALFAAALTGAFALHAAQAQTTPDPLAPGAAAADDAKSEAAKPAAAAPKRAEHARPRPHAEGGAVIAITVDNKRSVGLIELSVGPAGGADPKKVVGPLAFGRKTVIHLKRTPDCLYDIRGKFADEADTEQLGVDLCKDKAINLTDE